MPTDLTTQESAKNAQTSIVDYDNLRVEALRLAVSHGNSRTMGAEEILTVANNFYGFLTFDDDGGDNSDDDDA